MYQPNAVEIIVDYKIVIAIPAPIGANRPIPDSHYEPKTARKPKPVMVAVYPLDSVTVGNADAFKTSVLKGVVNMEALVVWPVVAVPAVVVNVLCLIPSPVVMLFHFWFCMNIVAARRRWRHVPLIGARHGTSVLGLGVRRLGMLGHGRRTPSKRPRIRIDFGLMMCP
jgi:hypothetical protein